MGSFLRVRPGTPRCTISHNSAHRPYPGRARPAFTQYAWIWRAARAAPRTTAGDGRCAEPELARLDPVQRDERPGSRPSARPNASASPSPTV
jgi:hypothetical protein